MSRADRKGSQCKSRREPWASPTVSVVSPRHRRRPAAGDRQRHMSASEAVNGWQRRDSNPRAGGTRAQQNNAGRKCITKWAFGEVVILTVHFALWICAPLPVLANCVPAKQVVAADHGSVYLHNNKALMVVSNNSQVITIDWACENRSRLFVSAICRVPIGHVQPSKMYYEVQASNGSIIYQPSQIPNDSKTT